MLINTQSRRSFPRLPRLTVSPARVAELWQGDHFACSQSAHTFEGVLLAGGLNRIRLGINSPPPMNCYVGGAGSDSESDNSQRYSE